MEQQNAYPSIAPDLTLVFIGFMLFLSWCVCLRSLFCLVVWTHKFCLKDCLSLGIYRPNTAHSADIDIFMKTLYDTNDIILVENKTYVLMGDFNIDLIKYNQHQKTTEFLDNLLAQGYFPMITKPTRVTHNSATLIDHIFTNHNLQNITSGIVITDNWRCRRPFWYFSYTTWW